MKPFVNIYRTIYLILFCTLWFGGIGQSVYTKSTVRSMFPVNTKGVWINYLSGMLGDRHVVDMILGTDGHTFRGVYTLRSSGVSFFIEGQDQDHVLRLVEMNGDQRLSGFINSKYDGKYFEGQWYNRDQSLTIPLKLTVVNDFNDVTSPNCGHQNWERIFSGKMQSKTIKLYLKRDGMVFHCRFMDSTRVIRDVLVGKGGRVEILTFDFSNTILDGNWLVLDTARLDKLDVVTLDEGGYEVPSSLKLLSALDYNCYEYADYYARIYGARPTTGHRKFDIWIEKAFREWAEDSADMLVEEGRTELGTKDRWILSAEAWVEIGFFSEELISGTIHFQNNVSNALDKKTFIYDLKAGKDLALKDIFESPSVAKDFMDAYIRNHLPGEKMDDREKRWVAKQHFQYMTFTEDGVSFKTDFSAIYGEREIILPYENVKPFFKKNFVLNQVTTR